MSSNQLKNQSICLCSFLCISQAAHYEKDFFNDGNDLYGMAHTVGIGLPQYK